MAMVGWNLFKHPEEGKGESFVGNLPKSEWPRPQYATLSTVRAGTQAFDIEGNPLGDDYIPVFIGTSEESKYEKSMKERK